MSVTFNVRCLDCGIVAPGVGDFGYIGYPSLSEDKGPRYIPNFGYIYRGLVALGLKSQAVEELYAFLLVHQEHVMEMLCEGAPMFGEDDGDEDGDGAAFDEEEGEDEDEDDEDAGEASEDEDRDDEEDEDDGDDGDDSGEGDQGEEAEDEDEDEDGEDDRSLLVNPRRFVASHYEVSCPRCGQTMRSRSFDRVLPFKARALTRAEVRDALRRVTGADSFERASEPFGPDDFERICLFLEEHAAHGPKVAWVPK